MLVLIHKFRKITIIIYNRNIIKNTYIYLGTLMDVNICPVWDFSVHWTEFLSMDGIYKNGRNLQKIRRNFWDSAGKFRKSTWTEIGGKRVKRREKHGNSAGNGQNYPELQSQQKARVVSELDGKNMNGRNFLQNLSGQKFVSHWSSRCIYTCASCFQFCLPPTFLLPFEAPNHFPGVNRLWRIILRHLWGRVDRVPRRRPTASNHLETSYNINASSCKGGNLTH